MSVAALTQEAPVRGTVFGYQVRSHVPLAYLRHGGGEPLEVTEYAESGVRADEPVLMSTTPTRAQPWHARLYGRGTGYRLWIAGGGWFEVDPDGRRIALPRVEDLVRREERLWGMPTLLCLIRRGDLTLHAAAVEVDGRAIVLAAPGNFGKTTLAAAFVRAGHRLLSEDVSCVRLGPETAVVPGPAMLRPRVDVARWLDVPSARVVGTGGGRVHLALAESERGDCRPRPLRAVVLLLPAEGLGRLAPVPAAAAVRDLWALAFRLPGAADAGRCFPQLTALAGAVPVWHLPRPLRPDALQATVERIAADA